MTLHVVPCYTYGLLCLWHCSSSWQQSVFKSKNEEIECIIGILKEKYVVSNEKEVETCLRNGGVLCRGKCQKNLTRLVKLKKEIKSLEHEVKDKFGSFVTRSGFVLTSHNEQPAISPEQSRLESHTPKSRKRNSSAVGVSK